MIRKKTKQEIEIIRHGGKILAKILNEICALAQPGVKTGEMEKRANEIMIRLGGRPAFKNLVMHDGEKFPTALCISINDEIVHGPALPSRVLKDGDVVGVDIGMEYPISNTVEPRNVYSKLGGYYTDMAKTVIVGKADEVAKNLVDVTREALNLAICEVRPGNSLDDIGSAVQEYVEKKGFSVVKDLVGHGVGHDIHEDPQVPNYKIRDNELDNIILEPGMVLAIEPMINIGNHKIILKPDGFTFATADGSLSAHFEHTVAVTEEGCLVLTEL
ncbi:MAG: type I methionyl aminopeptidase [bacterium]